MKKIKLFILLFPITILLSITGFSQSNTASISLDASYGFGAFKNSVETFVNTELQDDIYKSQNKKFSLGSGPALLANFSYSVSSFASVNLGFKYSFLAKADFNEVTAIGGVALTKNRVLSANRSSLIPALQFNTDNEKINTFIRLGVSINITDQKLMETTELDSNKMEYFWEYKGKPNLGLSVMWGLQYKLKSNLSATLSFTFENYTYTPHYAGIVEVRDNNKIEHNPNLLAIESEIDFNDWVEDQYSQNPDVNKPLQLPEQTFNYSNFSVSLGIVYVL